MDISWFGSTCFRLTSGGVSILTDPFDLPTSAAAQSAQVVTLSRRVPPEELAVTGQYRLVDGPGEYEIKGIPITGIATAGRDLAAAEAGAPAVLASSHRNVVYTITIDGVSVCHLGRLAQALTTQQSQEIGLPSVMILPLGGADGLTVPRAVQLATQLEAKILIPISIAGPEGRSAVEGFCKELGADPDATESRLTVTNASLPAQARVVVLERREPA